MRALFWALMLLCLNAEPALAYVGPGAGLTFIGSLVALVSAVLAGIFGFVWFPIKRLLRARKKKQDGDRPGAE